MKTIVQLKHFRKMDVMKKLPIGLGLACMMMLGSCSKENVVSPEAQIAGKSGVSPAPIILELPSLAPTHGTTGLDVYPLKWERNNNNYFGDLQKLPTGTSSFTHLWGDPSNPWVTPLPVIPSGQNTGSILTITTGASSWQDELGKGSSVKSVIKNLMPGKHYTVKFYVASTIPAIQDSSVNCVYAKSARIAMFFPKPNAPSVHDYPVDLTNSNANWVVKTITFEAHYKEAVFGFSAYAPKPGQYSFAHIYVDKNSVKKID
ncbi:hypothetical protein [Dyadobacter sp. CY343]|uniref:hypothetical protein n=1 Tax=Dyadobacter sp. CY343 TaxID=2907299 RepID=UPI001F39F0E4|nr:hypothetical protein [Dyadobacter sp. CY343]MCE7062412.1 hypothetical protein [Dyadobacter sp. CY343]